MAGEPVLPPAPWRALLLLAACDSLGAGLWLALRPADWLHFLQAPASPDAPPLARVLGVLLVGHAPCLALAAGSKAAGTSRAARRGLVLVPAFGRALLVGLWLWLLGTDRVSLPAGPLLTLLAHDGAVLALCLAFLALGGRGRGGGD